jgi:endonuclease/exonuclease/phosphatase family metal-dependent hydrolase
VPGMAAYRALARSLKDAQRLAPQAPLATFPAIRPFLRIDHIFLSPGLAVTRAEVPRDALARRASDHLPLIVDIAASSLTRRQGRQASETS